MFSFLFRKRQSSRSTKSNTRRLGRPGVLRLEVLEDRCVPALLQVGVHEPYATITSALQAARPGDTVLVHPGTYQEAVNITKNNITLEGVNQSAVIQAPSSLASNDFSIVDVNGASGVTIRDLTIKGIYTGDLTQVQNYLLGLHAGIYVSHGGSATISHNHVTGIIEIPHAPPQIVNINDLPTIDDGYAILVGSDTPVLKTTGSAVITGNTIDYYEHCGIEVANTGSSATIQNNTVTGLPLAAARDFPNQIGIAVVSGATGRIVHNRVSNNVQTWANIYPYGIYLLNSGTGVIVTGNFVAGNSTGIFASTSAGATITGNTVSGTMNDGIDLSSVFGTTTLQGNIIDRNGGQGVSLLNSTGVTLRGNRVSKNVLDGIFADSPSAGNSFVRNALSGNGHYDAEDDSTGTGTAGTANTWTGNKGKTDNKGHALLA
jgi:parallel beta-helix repeat protein